MANHHNAYVAFLDILGFKELVTFNEPDDLERIYDTASNLSRDTHQMLIDNYIHHEHLSEEYKQEVLKRLNIGVLSVSDSIVMWTTDDSPISLYLLILFVEGTLAMFLASGIPLRGAISHGPISAKTLGFTTTNIGQMNVFGKGIINAYNLEGGQEWSGCIVEPRCVDDLLAVGSEGERIYKQLFGERDLVEYEVPHKRGKVKKSYAVNWTQLMGREAFDDSTFEEGFKALFSLHNKSVDEWSVKVKLDNTVKFYKEFHER